MNMVARRALFLASLPAWALVYIIGHILFLPYFAVAFPATWMIVGNSQKACDKVMGAYWWQLWDSPYYCWQGKGEIARITQFYRWSVTPPPPKPIPPSIDQKIFELEVWHKEYETKR